MIKEACIESFEEAVAAEKRGADRVELCDNLDVGGTTPSVSLIQKTCATLQIPVMVIIRPRGGDFVYSEEELKTMQHSIAMAKEAGAAGIVLGILTKNNEIDTEKTQKLVQLCHPLPVTFHKAIDELDNPVEGVLQLKKIDGITRILTSGGKATAKEGIETLKKMIEAADDKITILIAGKVTNENIEAIQKATNAKELHGRKIVGQLS